MADFFYDKQIARFLVQFSKIFSNWTVVKGVDPNGNETLIRIPIMYGDMSRSAAAALNDGSPNQLASVPMLSYYISGLEYDQSRTQEPYFIDKFTVRQRKFDAELNDFVPVQGNAFSVERIMPVPYTLRITVDLWTSNHAQKLQFIEQVGVLFNPSMEIQSTDNFLDWTSLSVVYQDGITWSSRSVPMGTGNPIDVLTWKFYMPIWISSSAKVKKMNVIHKIITSIRDGTKIDDMADDDLLMGTRQKITPLGYKVLLLGNSLQLLPSNAPFKVKNNELPRPEHPVTDEVSWSAYLDMYGVVRPGISQIWLLNPDLSTPIVGTIAFNPNDDKLLQFTPDPLTLPQNTLAPVDTIIDPTEKWPGNGLPDAVLGTRYLLVNVPNEYNDHWGGLTANTNDIIEYDGSKWTVVFDSASIKTVEYVTNLRSSIQYRFKSGSWVKSYEGWYAAGDFSIVI